MPIEIKRWAGDRVGRSLLALPALNRSDCNSIHGEHKPRYYFCTNALMSQGNNKWARQYLSFHLFVNCFVRRVLFRECRIKRLTKKSRDHG